MAEMVRLDKLAKRFGPVQAVEEVSFGLVRGEVLGFLGPNGAGKTTTMRMLTGFVVPSGGTASVMGNDVVKRPIEARKLVGYLPEGAPLYADMSVAAFLDFIAEMRGFSGKEKKRRIDAAVARTQLAEALPRPIEALSKGFKRRVGLAQAILHDPPILVLDEPTDGLDPNQKHEVRKLIGEMAEEKAIIISTHILEEVEAICTRAMVIAKGRVVADERPDMLRRRSRHHNALRITCDANLAPRVAERLAAVPGVAAVETVGKVNGVATLMAFPAAGAEIGHGAGQALRESHLEVSEFAIEPGRLDDVFRELTLPAEARAV